MTNKRAGRGGNGKFIRTAATAERDAEACRLRSRGLSYRAIAAQLGITPGAAHEAVQRALRDTVQEPADDVRDMELKRLDDELQRLDALYAKASEVLAREHVTVSQGRVVYMDDGSPVPDDDWILKAVDRLIRIEESRRRNGESRRKLLGLDAPARVSVDAENLGAEIGQLLTALTEDAP